MFEKFKNIKQWVVSAVQWAEVELKDKSGAEKRAAVVARLDEAIKLPFWMEWVDGPVIGWLVDLACEKLNWLSGYDFSGVALDEKQTAELAEVLDAPVAKAAAVTGASVDERLKQLYEQYGVEARAAEAEAFADADADADTDGMKWEKSVAFLLKWEGGKNFTVKNGQVALKDSAKNDAGGATAYGVTVPALKAAYAAGVVGHGDIASLTLEDAKKIYRKNYWERYGWGDLDFPVCLCCLDCSVNHGGFAWILQRACQDCGRKLSVDGKFGPETFRSLKACDPSDLAQAIVDERKIYYQKIVASKPSQKVFLKGWMNRARAMAEAAGAR